MQVSITVNRRKRVLALILDAWDLVVCHVNFFGSFIGFFSKQLLRIEPSILYYALLCFLFDVSPPRTGRGG